MKKQQREFDGSSIHGQKLKVYFKGDGVLSSSFVIERSKGSPFNSVVFILPCIAVAAVCQVRQMVRTLLSAVYRDLNYNGLILWFIL